MENGLDELLTASSSESSDDEGINREAHAQLRMPQVADKECADWEVLLAIAVTSGNYLILPSLHNWLMSLCKGSDLSDKLCTYNSNGRQLLFELSLTACGYHILDARVVAELGRWLHGAVHQVEYALLGARARGEGHSQVLRLHPQSAGHPGDQAHLRKPASGWLLGLDKPVDPRG